MKYSYQTEGTCSRQIDVELDGDIVKEVTFHGGCHGNTQGISSLVKGMNVREVISRLEGIRCKSKSTSCPDQLSRALRECMSAKE